MKILVIFVQKAIFLDHINNAYVAHRIVRFAKGTLKAIKLAVFTVRQDITSKTKKLVKKYPYQTVLGIKLISAINANKNIILIKENVKHVHLIVRLVVTKIIVGVAK